MKKRLISMILSAALLATSVPVTAFAEDANTQNPVVHSEEGTSQGSNVRKESSIDYKKNGGAFVEGYTAIKYTAFDRIILNYNAYSHYTNIGAYKDYGSIKIEIPQN